MDAISENDVSPFESIFYNKSETKSTSTTTIDPNANCYKMTHSRRGIAVILNQRVFDGDLKKRHGTTKDAEDLRAILTQLKFHVNIYNDLKYGAIYDLLGNLSNSDHSDADCFLMAVLTHGGSGRIHARDHSYPPDELWKAFSGDKCPSLAGKPKLFFIQACRGDEVDEGVRIQSRTQSDAVSGSYTIPVMADILVMYSCYDGFYSWRSDMHGSWFIQLFCEQLRSRATSTDLVTILTFLNQRMAVSYESHSLTARKHQTKQIGTIVSTLTRLLYFYETF